MQYFHTRSTQRFIIFFFSGILITLLFSCRGSINPPKKVFADKVLMEDIQLPEGFKIHKYAENIVNARSMVYSAELKTLFVGTRKSDKVYALKDLDGDNIIDKKYIIAEKMNMPNGVAIKNGDLYVAEVDKIWKFSNIGKNLDAYAEKSITPELIFDQFPSETHHGWKYIAFGPDGKLYVPVGAPCNICESDSIYTTITRMNDDGSNFEIIATGIRNTVGFDWDPANNDLWFTDNGRDWLGDDSPACELNHLIKEGQHFGYPYCHQGDVLDPEFGKGKNCEDYTAPYQNLGPHVAPLGMEFYEDKMFPKEYKDAIFIAEHGSWNRSEKIGYRITMVDRSKPVGERYSTFANGWYKGNDNVSGRPVDLEWLPDGSLLVSDDFGDAIYRIYYEK
ncbi:MAG: PQQ-dependent sugar dehydrogenase [Chitinophagales bacterium]